MERASKCGNALYSRTNILQDTLCVDRSSKGTASGEWGEGRWGASGVTSVGRPKCASMRLIAKGSVTALSSVRCYGDEALDESDWRKAKGERLWCCRARGPPTHKSLARRHLNNDQ